jgi:hypothetical protein
MSSDLFVARSFPSVGKDARRDLGYGKDAKFHVPRQQAGCYPYANCEDQYNNQDSDAELDAETILALFSKTVPAVKNDPYSIKGTTPFYFAAGSTKLSDCFERPDEVLAEVHTLAKSMWPIPTNRNKRRTGLPGASAKYPTGARMYRRPGSKEGYFYGTSNQIFDPSKDPSDAPVDSIRDLADKMRKLKSI